MFRRDVGTRGWTLALGAVALAALAVAVLAVRDSPRRGAGREIGEGRLARVASVVDGDTFTVSGGREVRLLQVDAPELPEACYAAESRAALAKLLPKGSAVRLVDDPALDFRAGRHKLDLDKVDRYGPDLAYVIRDGDNVNVRLVERGAARVRFLGGGGGRYAKGLLAAAERAKAQRRGLWRACPPTRAQN